MSTSVSSIGITPTGASLHARFEALLPRIQRHGEVYFRHVNCPIKKADFIAEMVALVWKWLLRLAERGKDGFQFPMALASYAARAVRSGRRLCGQEKATDVFSTVAQQRHSFTTESLPISTRTGFDNLYAQPRGQQNLDAWEERLRDNTRTPVDEQVAFKLDFRAWLRTLTPRERRIIKAMLRNERTKDLSKEFQVSEGRISQLRREFLTGWKCFVGDEPVCGRRMQRRRKKTVRA
jgi:Sigma-70, region 4